MARSSGIRGIFLSIFFNMKVCCVLSLANEYTHHTIINIKKKITLNYPIYDNDVFLGTQERVRNSYGKRSIGVRAIEVVLYFIY